MMKKKICIVTGTRAEWGLLSSLAGLIRSDEGMVLQIIATNMHLMERYGCTYREIEESGFHIDYRVPMDVEGDNPEDTVRSMGLAIQGFADAYADLRPDLIVVLGDRYEILMAVSAALIFKIPVAHLHGGEITEGAYDDAIRHAITKMSHLHFTSTEAYRQRVIQMGEQPDRVFNVGAIGVDNIVRLQHMNKEQTEQSLGGFQLDRNTFLITYHPVTLGNESPQKQIDELLGALDEVKEIRVLFTLPNSDTGNRVIGDSIRNWCEQNAERSIYFDSLGLKRYLSVLQYVGAVVGNSSSGIIEVPSFGIPTIDIGDRQKGRIAGPSVRHCECKQSDIVENMRSALKGGISNYQNPYYQPETAKQIHRVLQSFNYQCIKNFFDIKP